MVVHLHLYMLKMSVACLHLSLDECIFMLILTEESIFVYYRPHFNECPNMKLIDYHKKSAFESSSSLMTTNAQNKFIFMQNFLNAVKPDKQLSVLNNLR